MPTYTTIGAGIVDEHSPYRTTLVGVSIGSTGLCILEVEEQHRLRPTTREYAEVALSLNGARQLRAELDAAIRRLERDGAGS